jgi:acyl-CoA synthetase (AMP-forming)/AMP-acid ligase II
MRDDLPALRRLWRIDDGLVDALVADGAAVPESEVDRRRSGVSPDHPATIIYTSGTTGRPKGCVLSHANFFAEAGNAVELLRPMFERTAGAEACTLLFLPLAHVFGRMVQVGSVQARTPLAHTDLTAVLDDLGSYRPTFILSVPYVLEKVYNGARHKARAAGRGALFDAAAATAISYSEARRPGAVLRLKHAVYDRLVYRRLRAALGGRCRYAISGGAALGERLTHFYRGIGLTVFEGYGLTETTGAIALNSLDAFRPGTVGRPLPGVSIRIADDGEVLARGGPVFSGYWQDEASTRETFTADGWFRTGDLGALDDDGYLSIVGRKKEILVTSGGKNVAPAAIEDRISAHPLVAQTLVVGDGQKYVAALITIDPEHFGHWRPPPGSRPGHPGRPRPGPRPAGRDPGRGRRGQRRGLGGRVGAPVPGAARRVHRAERAPHPVAQGAPRRDHGRFRRGRRRPVRQRVPGSGRRHRRHPVDAVDVVQRRVDRVVGFHVALRDAGQAGLLQGAPGRDVGRDDGHDDPGRARVVDPGRVDERPDHPRPQAAARQAGFADQVVDRHGVRRHRDECGELGQLVGVVGDPAALGQPERVAAELGDEVLGRFLPPCGGTEVPADRLRGGSRGSTSGPRRARPASVRASGNRPRPPGAS